MSAFGQTVFKKLACKFINVGPSPIMRKSGNMREITLKKIRTHLIIMATALRPIKHLGKVGAVFC
jgi:hypothetical protein